MSGACKRRATAWIAGCWRRPPLTPQELLALRPRRILLVRQHNQMGDMVCATPCFCAIKQTWPQAQMALITAPVNREVVVHNPHLDRLFLFEQRLWRRPAALAAWLRDLRRFDAELALVLNSVSFSVTSALLALWSPARWVVGGDSAPFHSGVSRAYSLRLPTNPLLDRHAVLHSLAPLQAVGITTTDLSTVMRLADAERHEARALTERLLPPGPFWALHPGAGKRQNCWPAERFAAVARRVAQLGIPVLVLHGPADRQALAGFRDALGEAVPTGAGAPVVVAPAVNVGTAAAVLDRSDRFLCNDTGLMHVAGALGVPTLALFGPTDPALWKPPAAAVRALRSPTRVADARGQEFGWMEGLTTDAVWIAWRGLPGRQIGPLT
ncbi:MAG: glycosyltransferase family 9 protein [Candidatus Krumholzibacteria bacterium]|nr:glycosyltransferase family 9 protein [Candidatus Krumholzibacteria bacterium]